MSFVTEDAPSRQQSLEHSKRQRWSHLRVCSSPTQLEQGSHVHPDMLLNVGQVHVQSHTKNRNAACHKSLVAAKKLLSPNAREVVWKFSNDESMQ